MSDTVIVSLAEIRALANKLCDVIEARGQTAAEVDTQPRWTIYFEDMFGPIQPQAVAGYLSDDLSDARKELIAAGESPVVWHAAHHLAELFRALAYADIKGTYV